MWRPPNFKKYVLPQADWPSEESARQSQWFSPVQLGPLTLTQRTWVPAMVPWRATEGGDTTPEVIEWYRRFAQGEPGAIVVEATGVRDVPSGPLLRISDDRFIAGLTELTRAVREASGGKTKLLLQLIDFLTIRRRVDRTKFLRYLPLSPRLRADLSSVSSALDPADDAACRALLGALPEGDFLRCLSPREREDFEYGYRERVTDLHLPHIRALPSALPQLFADAARRAEAAGFDGVELHAAHAYTLSSFLSALNTRDDGYGGSLQARVRLPLEVFRAVRSSVKSGFAVGVRFLADDIVAGGSRVADACYFGVEFARAGLDFLSLSRGGRFEDARQPKLGAALYPYTGESGYECMPTVYADERGPFGRNAEATGEVRRAVREAGYQTPVVVCGGVHSFEQAEALLEGGQADIVAAARQSLADPDWFKKVRLGRGAEVRRCCYTNYCEALDQMHKPVTCKLWDREALEQAAQLSPDGRRRLVAPGWSPE